MAEFISNSAILPLIRPTAALTAAPNSSPACEKWQTCAQTLPLTERARLPAPECNKIGHVVTLSWGLIGTVLAPACPARRTPTSLTALKPSGSLAEYVREHHKGAFSQTH